MHGIIFVAFRDYLTAAFGAAQAEVAFRGRSTYAMTEAYADDEFTEILAATATATTREQPTLLTDFGIFTGEIVFPRLYPAFYEVAGDPRTFLLTVEDRIHELVRATIPHAQPPRLHVAPADGQSVTITYDSPRRLCRLLEGLAIGTARHYRTAADVAEIQCVSRGSDACRFHVVFR